MHCVPVAPLHGMPKPKKAYVMGPLLMRCMPFKAHALHTFTFCAQQPLSPTYSSFISFRFFCNVSASALGSSWPAATAANCCCVVSVMLSTLRTTRGSPADLSSATHFACMACLNPTSATSGDTAACECKFEARDMGQYCWRYCAFLWCAYHQDRHSKLPLLISDMETAKHRPTHHVTCASTCHRSQVTSFAQKALEIASCMQTECVVLLDAAMSSSSLQLLDGEW